MHVLTISQPVNLGKTLGVLPAGKWLVHDLNAFEIARLAPRGAATVEHYAPRDHPSGRMLVIRSGAYGDLLLLTPALKELRKNGREIHLSCFNYQHDIFKGLTFIDALQSYPLPFGETDNYTEIVSLENTMESDHAHHVTDVFAKALGLKTPIADYCPVYHVTEEEKAAAKQYHLFDGRPNLVIHPMASVANRNYPLPLWMEVMRKAEQQGWGVLIIGSKGQVPPMPPQWANPFVRDLSQLGLTFRESAAVLSQAQAFCGVDSAWAHMCHALDIPAVVLMAAFDWRTRTSKAPKTIALTGVGECAPCNWHMHAGRQFPPGKPCTARQVCTVLAGITPDRILTKISLLKP